MQVKSEVLLLNKRPNTKKFTIFYVYINFKEEVKKQHLCKQCEKRMAYSENLMIYHM